MRLLNLFKRKPVKIAPTRNYKCLAIAEAEIGVKEGRGKANNKRIVKYHAYATVENRVGVDDSVPWCSSFMCYVTETAGMGSTNSKAARSWLKWGISVKDAPIAGDIIVFRRGSSSWQGHVALFLEKTKNGQYIVLGGNQSDMVSVAYYPASKMLDIRRSSKAGVYTKDELKSLQSLRDSILGR